MTGDTINGFFEFFGAVLILLSCRRLYLDKQVKGVSIIPTGFFTAWGFWNIYYYPSLGQWLSFAGGLCIVFINCIWLTMTFYYLRKQKREDHCVRSSETSGEGHGERVRVNVPTSREENQAG